VGSSHIQGRVQISKDLQQRKLGDKATKGSESIHALHKVFHKLDLLAGM
jgi:nucleoporin p58/p45